MTTRRVQAGPRRWQGVRNAGYADGITRGSVDAYVRTARAFGLVTGAEIIQLIPARFFKGPD